MVPAIAIAIAIAIAAVVIGSYQETVFSRSAPNRSASNVPSASATVTPF
jgi:hypothetical protein